MSRARGERYTSPPHLTGDAPPAGGWRFWFVQPTGMLLGPGHRSSAWPRSTHRAACPRGHAAPDVGCECGLYFVPEKAAFMGLLHKLLASWDGQVPPRLPIAIGWFRAEGRLLPEIDESVLRAERGSIGRLLLESRAQRLAPMIRRRYRVPVAVSSSSGVEWVRQVAADESL